MSSYIKQLKNPKTGKLQVAYCIDDYFGEHKYGYGFRKDGKDATFENLIHCECDFYKWEELEKETPPVIQIDKELQLFIKYCEIYKNYFKQSEIEGMDMVVGHLAVITRDAILQEQELLRKELAEKIENSPKTFGITDKKGKGGAILVEDVLAILKN
jgi:hypothetical protein